MPFDCARDDKKIAITVTFVAVFLYSAFKDVFVDGDFFFEIGDFLLLCFDCFLERCGV